MYLFRVNLMRNFSPMLDVEFNVLLENILRLTLRFLLNLNLMTLILL